MPRSKIHPAQLSALALVGFSSICGVGGGAPADAYEIPRDNVTDPATKLFWFAAGVGKIREENRTTGAVEELSAYEIP